jgi:hypothetical protein
MTPSPELHDNLCSDGINLFDRQDAIADMIMGLLRELVISRDHSLWQLAVAGCAPLRTSGTSAAEWGGGYRLKSRFQICYPHSTAKRAEVLARIALAILNITVILSKM